MVHTSVLITSNSVAIPPLIAGGADVSMSISLQIPKVSDFRVAVVIPTKEQDRWLLIEWGTQFSIELARALPGLPPPVLQTNNLQIAMDSLLKLGGCTYLPDTVAAPYIEKNQLWLVKVAPVIRRNIQIVWRQDNDDHPGLNRLIEELKSSPHVRENQGGGIEYY